MNTIYSPEKFIYQKSKIPNLDILFKRLLTIEPEDRMTFDEFFKYVFSEDFMNKDIICVNGNKEYEKIYESISKEEDVVFKEV